MPTIKEAILAAVQQLEVMSDSPQLDAECLLAFVLDCARSYLMTYPEQLLSDKQQRSFAQLLSRRLQGEPVAYLLAEQEFYGLSLRVTPAVLIPRPETESLVDWILAQYAPSSLLRVLDCGTGSGAIAIALAKSRPTWQIVAADICAAALAIAADNAQRHQLSQIEFVLSDWFTQIVSSDFDVIVANPPYIAQTDAHLSALSFEPQTALVAADNGLADIDRILHQAQQYLTADGVLLIEHGYDQGQQIVQLARQYGWSRPRCYPDLAGQTRFLVAYAS